MCKWGWRAQIEGRVISHIYQIGVASVCEIEFSALELRFIHWYMLNIFGLGQPWLTAPALGEESMCHGIKQWLELRHNVWDLWLLEGDYKMAESRFHTPIHTYIHTQSPPPTDRLRHITLNYGHIISKVSPGGTSPFQHVIKREIEGYGD